MRNQNYGRVVCVASAAGLFGNAGQANYAAAKMAILGLANTLAKEGESRNVRVNTVAPLAGSRMTATVMPPEMVEALRPEHVAGVVAWLLHESCQANGMAVECGAGWAAAIRRERSRGWSVQTDKLTPESVRDNLERAKDFSQGASHPSSPADSTGVIIEVLAKHKSKL